MSAHSLYRFDRLTRIDDEPVLLEQFYLDAERFPGFERIDLEDASLARIVRETYFLEPTSADQTFTIVNGVAEIADQLQIDARHSILHVSRSLHFGQFAYAIHCNLYCRTDRNILIAQGCALTLRVKTSDNGDLNRCPPFLLPTFISTACLVRRTAAFFGISKKFIKPFHCLCTNGDQPPRATFTSAKCRQSGGNDNLQLLRRRAWRPQRRRQCRQSGA